MQGIFSTGNKYYPDDTFHEFDIYHGVIMERDVGPFKNGDHVDKALYNRMTGHLSLMSMDHYGNVTEYGCRVNVTYSVIGA